MQRGLRPGIFVGDKCKKREELSLEENGPTIFFADNFWPKFILTLIKDYF